MESYAKAFYDLDGAWNWMFEKPEEFLAATRDRQQRELVNATAFSSPQENRLYIDVSEAGFAGETTKVFTSLVFQRVRHEGTHLFLYRLGITEYAKELPFWLVEGIPTFYEIAPATWQRPDRLALIEGLKRQNKLIEWETLLHLQVKDRDQLKDASIHAAYAQSWLLTAYLLRPENRGAFLVYLASLKESGAAKHEEHLQTLMNNLKTTPSKLFSDIENDILKSGEDSIPISPQTKP